jgi:DNA-binding transcriptional ArsR family regulator
VACNARHQLRPRLARWLLTALDRAPSAAAGQPVTLPLTQEFLAEMLGVRPSAVSEAVLGFQEAGLVRLRRGGVQVLDRIGLERAACECYAAIQRRIARLLPVSSVSSRRATRAAPASEGR